MLAKLKRVCAARSLRRALWSAFGFSLLLPTLTAAQPALTRIRQVLELPVSSVTSRPPVRVRAVVTCVDETYSMLFIQDESAGIYLYRHNTPRPLAPGDLLDVAGQAAPGVYSPIIDRATVSLVGKTNLPASVALDIGSLLVGKEMGRRVSTVGVVQHVDRRSHHWTLHLAEGENSIAITIAVAPEDKDPGLLDARVRVHGVLASSFKGTQLTGFRLYANALSDVEVLERPERDAFEQPPIPTKELWSYTSGPHRTHRIHVRGVVTYHQPGRVTFLQDATGGVAIDGGAASELRPGDLVDAAGFLLPIRYGPRLRRSEVRVLGTTNLPPVAPLSWGNLPDANHRLVSLSGRVLGWEIGPNRELIGSMENSNVHFSAELHPSIAPESSAAFPPGSMLSLTGVLRIARLDAPDAPRLSVSVNRAADIAVLARPPEPLRRRAMVPALGVALALVLGFALLWLRYRRAVVHGRRRERELQLQFDEASRVLRHFHADREMLARELHDNMIQSVYSVGLGLEESLRLAPARPEHMPERIQIAIHSLNRLIQDIRAFIAGLEPRGLEGHELKTALKSVLLTSGTGQEARFTIQVDAAAARQLTSLQATEVFNIAKEAMTNSMRHANARQTVVTLTPSPRGVRLEIIDDGTGFNPEVGSGSSLGLAGMRSRARNIGAKLDILSTPGQGTRILLEVPTTSHDNG